MKKNAMPSYAGRPGIFIMTACLYAMLMIVWPSAVSAQDPFAALKKVAKTSDSVKMQLPATVITKSNPAWQWNARAPRPYTPIKMIDKAGKPIPPDRLITLPNGKQMTAAAWFEKVNQWEQALCKKGLSLRDNKAETVCQLITQKQDLMLKGTKLAKKSSIIREAADLEKFRDPTVRSGNISLKPLGMYTTSERKSLEANVVKDLGNGNYKLSPVSAPVKIDGALLQGPALLKTINETTLYDKHVGKVSTIFAGASIKLTRIAKIFGTDPKHPNTNISEFSVAGEGNFYGGLVNHSFNILSGKGSFYASADSSKKMNLKLAISVLGINILNQNEDYTQHHAVSGIKAKDFEKSGSISVPLILGIIDFTGLIGIKGTIGVEYKGDLDRSYLKGEIKPYAAVEGYAAAGVSDPTGTFTLGARADLTFMEGYMDASAWFGIMNQNSNQIIFGYGYDVSYSMTFLKGYLQGFARACLDLGYFGTYCDEYDVDLFRFAGIKEYGTIAEGRKLYFLYNNKLNTKNP